MTQPLLPSLDDLLKATLDGRALTRVQSARLLALTDPAEIRAVLQAADALRQELVGETVPCIRQVSLFLTNQCELRPACFAYPKEAGDKGAFVATIDDLDAILERAATMEAEQAFIASGFHAGLLIPGLEQSTPLKTYGRVLAYLRDRSPELSIQAYSPDFIDFLAVLSDRSYQYILEYLQDMGLRSLSGYTLGLLSDGYRRQLSPKYAPVKEWTAIVRTAHALGLAIPLAMTLGHTETPDLLARHLDRARRLLQEAPGLFSSLQPIQTPIFSRKYSGVRRWLPLAVARLSLSGDLRNIQTLWLPDGAELAQEGLGNGANHFGATDAMQLPGFLWGGSRQPALSPEEATKLVAETGRELRWESPLGSAAPSR